MSKDNFCIAVLGGMGTYATINLFHQYAKIFPAEKEWERPRIIIDNRCTMPSRVRALQYNENVEQLVSEMSDSIGNLISVGGEKTRVILACNTSHLFLPKIFEQIPFAESHIVNIIDTCVDELHNRGISRVYLLGTESTIDSKVYHKKLDLLGMECISPGAELYPKIRECIEAVKTGVYSAKIKALFLELMSSEYPIILGCTELPILYDMYCKEILNKKVFDPLYLALKKISEEYNNA